MGNMACVPHASGRLRYSFSRKPSLRKEQDSKKKLAGLFGFEPGQERDVTSDKILQYIPGKSLTAQENGKENIDQRFPGLFKKGRRKTVVRNLGKIIYYSKVKFKFQHCQEVNDCYLELFQAYLYFQSLGPNGLTYQGLLPLRELQLTELESPKGTEQEVHAFQITGHLLSPLIVYCPNRTEVKRWLYHLEKQIHLNGGSLDLPFLTQNDLKQSAVGREQLRWSVQHAPVQEWRGTQRESLGDILCVSKVQLQHLPFQEAHDRLLILYPSTLVIVSEERNGLYFKGELPLNAIQVQFEENQKTSFLIEGRLINSIRVICPSYEDYQEWLYCLKTAQFRNADSSLSGSESFSGPKPPHLTQFSGSGRGSLTSDGRTNSWASGGKGATSTHHSQNSTGSRSEKQSFGVMPENRLAEGPQTVHCIGNPAIPKPELKRKGSSRRSKGKCGLQQPQLNSQDSERSNFQLIPEHAGGEVLSPVYNEPYTALVQQQQQHPAGPQLHLDLNHLKQWNSPRSQNCTAPQNVENTPLSCSPMYADPYTPNSPTLHGASDSKFAEEFMRHHGETTLEQQNGYPAMPVSVPITHHLPVQKKNPQSFPGNHWREPPTAQRSSPILNISAMPPSDTDYLTAHTLSRDREELRLPSLPTSEKSIGTYNLPESGRERLDSTYHDYAELQSFQSDFSYDNIWDMETKDSDIYHC